MFTSWVMIVLLGTGAGIAVPGSYFSKEDCLAAVSASVATADGTREAGAAQFGRFLCVPVGLSQSGE